MNKTANFQLTQWEKMDRIMMEDFNRDNAAIDAALKSNADKAAALQTALAGAGNCRIAVTGYTGKGKYGIENSNQLTFQYPPLAVFIFGEDVGLMSRGKRLCVVRSGSTASAEATWAADGKSVRWHSGHATAQMNEENVSYTVVYLYQA